VKVIEPQCIDEESDDEGSFYGSSDDDAIRVRPGHSEEEIREPMSLMISFKVWK
jgi:hypothetical protein